MYDQNFTHLLLNISNSHYASGVMQSVGSLEHVLLYTWVKLQS